ncbi:hypothetical protein WJX82_000761 [Trebouxia sp. C0006]
MNILSVVRVVLILLAWIAIIPFLLQLWSVVLATWRYSYTLSESFWATLETKWTTPDKMLPATVLYNDRFGGGYYTLFIVWWWAPTLAAVILVAAVPSVPYAKRLGARSAFATVAHQFKSAGSYQMYPRKFWMTVMGGLTVLEAILLAIWITLNVVMLWNWYYYYTESYDYVQHVIGMDFAIPRPQMNLERMALCFGWLCFLDVSILFWPIAHNSFLHQLTGVPYPVLIRFHRWVGHTTMWSTTLHGIFYFIYWGIDNDVNGWTKFADWGQVSSINNLAGSVSWWFGLALWVTSVNYVRRRWYSVYQSVHMVGFLGYVLFALIHYPAMWVSIVPGLLLYAADIALRMCQSSNVSTVTNWRVIGKGNNRAIVMTLPVDKDVEMKPQHDYFVNFPGVSRWHWHPLTCLYPQGQQGQPGGSVTFCMKQKGKWSTAVIDEIINTEYVPVRVNGPIGGDSILSQNYDHLLFVAGGVAAVPLLSVIEDMVKQRSAGGPDATLVPASVCLIWTSREREEFTLLSETIMAAASCGDGWLTIDLIYSGAVTVPAQQPLKGTPHQLQANKLEEEGTAVKNLVESHPEGKTYFSEANGAISLSSSPRAAGRCPVSSHSRTHGGCPLKFPGASALFWDRVRPIQPKALNQWHYMACAIMAFVGGLFGVVLGNSFINEFYTAYPVNNRYWQGGLVIFCTIMVTAVGLPLALVVFPVQFYRYMRSNSKAGCEKDAAIMSQGMERTAALLMDETVGFQESGMSLPIKIGRIDLTATLQETVQQQKASSRVGFSCGGPEAMVRTAAMTAWRLNDESKGAYLHFHRATHEL